MKFTAIFQKVPEGFVGFVEELVGAGPARRCAVLSALLLPTLLLSALLLAALLLSAWLLAAALLAALLPPALRELPSTGPRRVARPVRPSLPCRHRGVLAPLPQPVAQRRHPLRECTRPLERVLRALPRRRARGGHRLGHAVADRVEILADLLLVPSLSGGTHATKDVDGSPVIGRPTRHF